MLSQTMACLVQPKSLTQLDGSTLPQKKTKNGIATTVTMAIL